MTSLVAAYENLSSQSFRSSRPRRDEFRDLGATRLWSETRSQISFTRTPPAPPPVRGRALAATPGPGRHGHACERYRAERRSAGANAACLRRRPAAHPARIGGRILPRRCVVLGRVPGDPGLGSRTHPVEATCGTRISPVSVRLTTKIRRGRSSLVISSSLRAPRRLVMPPISDCLQQRRDLVGHDVPDDVEINPEIGVD